MTQVIKDHKSLKKKSAITKRKKKYNDLIKKILSSRDFFSNLIQGKDLAEFKAKLAKISNSSNIHIARSNELSNIHIDKILKITRDNMKTLYDENPWGYLWSEGWDDNLKLKELKHYMCNYLIIYERNTHITGSDTVNTSKYPDISFYSNLCSDINILSFLSFRFELEYEEITSSKQIVGYMYELQSLIKGKGYGKLLIDIFRFICNKLQVNKIMCTVLKENTDALRFYTKKCGFYIDEISPTHEPYMILSSNTI